MSRFTGPFRVFYCRRGCYSLVAMQGEPDKQAHPGCPVCGGPWHSRPYDPMPLMPRKGVTRAPTKGIEADDPQGPALFCD